jgi:phosphatidylglycerol:prolipoprotein diacylglycerol transferase
MLPTLPIGPLSLPVPGIILIIGLWLGTTVAEHFSPKRNIPSNTLYNLVLAILVSAALASRLGFVALNPSSYLARPLDMIALNITASDPWSGLAGGTLAFLIFVKRYKLQLLDTFDALTPLAAVFMISFHLANLASGAAFGSQSNLPWTIYLWGADRHPVQAYEAVAAVAILFLLWQRYLLKPNQNPGEVFLVFIEWTVASRLLWEGFHGDSNLVGNFRFVQIAAWCILLITLVVRFRQKSSKVSN